MIFLPISINITNRKILLIGGGRIAAHKLVLLERFTRNISVIGAEVSESIKAKGYPFTEKEYETSDLEGAYLVYACTNNNDLNRQIKNDAESLGILVNVVDNSDLSDFVSPAIYKHQNITVAVGSNAQNVSKAIEIRDKIKEFIENDPLFFR